MRRETQKREARGVGERFFQGGKENDPVGSRAIFWRTAMRKTKECVRILLLGHESGTEGRKGGRAWRDIGQYCHF